MHLRRKKKGKRLFRLPGITLKEWLKIKVFGCLWVTKVSID